MLQEHETSEMRGSVRAVCIFYAIALLLNAQALERQADLLPYGPGRTVAVAILWPVARVAAWGPGCVRAWVETGRESLWKRLENRS